MTDKKKRGPAGEPDRAPHSPSQPFNTDPAAASRGKASGSNIGQDRPCSLAGLAKLPAKLRALPGYLLWREETKPGASKPDKVPYCIDGFKRSGKEGSARDLARLASFADTVAAYKSGKFDGVGRAMLPQWNLIALDLDRKPGKEDEWLSDAEIAELTAGTYAELSPSGKGVRAFFWGQMPNIKGGKRGVEVFCDGQFVTVTGNKLPDSPTAIAPLPDAIRAKLDTFRKDKAKPDAGDDVGKGPKPRMHLTLDQVRGLLAKLPDEWFDDYIDRWLTVCMAMHHEGEGKTEWLALLHEVSRERCPTKYDAALIDYKWTRFSSNRPDAASMFGLAQVAIANGWVQPPLHDAAAAEFGPVPPGGGDDAGSARAGGRELVIVGGDEIDPRGTNWLWPTRVPRKFITVCAGDSGSGKTTAIADAVGRITTGRPWPDDRAGTQQPPALVLWLGVEDPLAEVTVPRLMAANADLSRVKFIQGTRRPGADGPDLFSIQDDLDLLRGTLRRMRAAGNEVALIVVDPVTAYLHGKRKVNLHVPTEFRAVLQPFATLCDEEDVAVVCITHLTKDKSRGFLDSIMGSGALVQLSRAVWGFAHVPGEEEDSFAMFWGMGNLGAAGIALRYRIERRYVISSATGEIIETSRVVWGEEDATLTKETVLGGSRGPDAYARNEVAAWLRARLADRDWHSAQVVNAAALAEGFSPSAITRATKEVCDKKPFHDGWKWKLKGEEVKTKT